ncbi:MAG: hypothetical protein GWN58_37390, partial [Anaerolineae bacterium]|nr:hypothetical protein [Anaerolineae bacterium]
MGAAWDRGHWHPRFGLPDAFHGEISEIGEAKLPDDALRESGPWVQRALFAIDQGPMLLHLENARSGLIHEQLARDPNIQAALDRLAPVVSMQLVFPSHEGTGDGVFLPRSNAWGEQTVL